MNSKLKKKKLILNFLCLSLGFFEIFQFIIPELIVLPYPRSIGLAFVMITGIDFTGQLFIGGSHLSRISINLVHVALTLSVTELNVLVWKLPRDHENAVLCLKRPKSAAKHGLHPT